MAAQQPTLRAAKRDDVPTILALIKELADFERAPEKVEATEEILHETLSFPPTLTDLSPTSGFAKCMLAVYAGSPSSSVPEEQTERVAGFAVYFYNFSTWTARPGIYLEDLYVRQAFRRRGVATVLLKELARQAREVSHGTGRLDWSVLKWNENALKFYLGIGGKVLDEWSPVRVDGEELKRLAEMEVKSAGA